MSVYLIEEKDLKLCEIYYVYIPNKNSFIGEATFLAGGGSRGLTQFV